MGLTFIEGVVTGPKNKKATVNFLVDSGATYTLRSEQQWKSIEVTPTRSMTFTLADGTKVVREISECCRR